MIILQLIVLFSFDNEVKKKGRGFNNRGLWGAWIKLISKHSDPCRGFPGHS